MTLGLLKTHTYIWLAMIIVIPVLLFFSIRNLDFSTPKQEVFYGSNVVGEPLAAGENEFIKAIVYKDDTSKLMLEVVLKTTLKNSSALVIPITENGDEASIGQVSDKGVYTFILEKKPKSLSLKDALKDEYITTIPL